MRRRTRHLLRCMGLWAGPWTVLTTGTAGGEQASTPDPPATLSSLNRLLRRFDFEEAEHAPYTMPINFYRHIAADQGFPPFGKMQLTNEVAHSGTWSFGFELHGGSLSARVPTAVIPVLPGGDYAVSAWIRTEALTHAKARLAAWLHDTHGNPIAESRAYSPLVQPNGRWQRASIEVYGDFEDAADLVVELQVLQPHQFTRSNDSTEQPLLEDVAGRAWFDDVVVWQRPRIELSTGSPGNVVAADQQPILNLLVRDATSDHLTAQLRVRDLNGAAVHDETFQLPKGSWLKTIELAGIRGGWYRAVLDVANTDMVVASGSLDFIVLPQSAATDRHGTQERRFGVVLPPMPADDLATAVRLVHHLGVGSAVMPLPDGTATPGSEYEGNLALRRTVDKLLAGNVELTLALHRIGQRLADQLGIEPTAVLELLGRDPELWPEALGEVLMNFGLDVPRWQIGVPGTVEGLNEEQLRRMVEAAAATLSDFVPEPIILVAFSAENELPPLPPQHGYWITVPYHVAGESLAAYASRWPIGERTVFTTLQRLPPEQYPPRARAIDLLLRALHGWRAGLPHMAITAPWGRRDQHGTTIMPDPSFGLWRVLADRLGGRTFAGEMPLADGLRCWILAGPGKDETALVAWNEQAAPDSGVIRLLLADGPVEVVDAFGNRRAVQPHEGVHTIALGRLPLFIEHVDGRLARFRAELAIRPNYVEARHQLHERELVLANPWDVTISGTIRLRPPAGSRITPRLHRFVIRPHQQQRLPINLVFDRSMPTGTTRVEADVELTADRDYHLRVHADLDVGLKNIEFAAYWRVAKNDRSGTDDLILTQYVTNTGDRPVYLNAYVSGPGISQQRRAIGALEPGRTAVRTFRLANGAVLLAGKQIRLGVTERDGTARLNRILEIPPLPGTSADERVASHDAE